MYAAQNCTNNLVTGIRIFNKEQVNTFPALVLGVTRSIRVELHVKCILTDRSSDFHFSKGICKGLIRNIYI
jgi:hypothetical protein